MERKRRKVIILISIIITALLITIGISVKASGNTEIAKSVTFTENMDGAYVYVRAVDAAGNKGAWSEAQRIWIDNTAPTVTAKESSVTITEGDVNNLADYFTVVANGSNTDVDVVCTINGVEYTTTETLTVDGSPYTVTCTASKNGGESNSETMKIEVKTGRVTADTINKNPLTYYGKVVTNYTTPSGDPDVQWKIFYADDTYVYLVASDYIKFEYTPTAKDEKTTLYAISDYKLNFKGLNSAYDGATNIKDINITDSRVLRYLSWVNEYPTSASPNIQSVAYMVDTVRWNNKYKNSIYAAYAIGGPTVEMFIASYNQMYPDKKLTYGINNSNGYYLGENGETATNYVVNGLDTENSLYIIDTYKCRYWWLASPSCGNYNSLIAVRDTGVIADSYYSQDLLVGFRPLICLNSDVKLHENNDGTYHLDCEQESCVMNQY